jgi:hypothetical protein
MTILSRRAGISAFLGLCLVFLAFYPDGFAATADTPQAKPAAPAALLPNQFEGWQIQGSAATSKNASVADPSNAAVLKEYRFTDFAAATYVRDDGRTLKIRAARFEDASGAFGAYTFYLQPDVHREEIGDQGASFAGKRVLFYRGYVLIDAQFSQESAMSGAELRALAGMLPMPGGNAGNLPTFIQFMPRRGSVPNTQKYVMGPAALAAQAPPVSADLVDFGTSAEVATGRYETPSGEATLMVISYPTPQIAADHLRRLDAARQQAPPQAGVSMIATAGQLSYKRSGPLLVIAAGPAAVSDAKSLVEMVSYEAKVTWNEATGSHDVHDLYTLILNVVILCAVVGGLAIVAGVAFGGVRILMKRWLPGKVFDRPEQMEFIALRLTERTVPATGPEGGRGLPPNPS